MADRAETAAAPAGKTLPPLAGALPSLTSLHPSGGFAERHIGPRAADTDEMLAAVGHPTLESLVDACVPEGVRDRTPLNLPAAEDEAAVLALLRERASANDVYTSMIGLGYYGTVTPAVIQRTVLENPSWYTAYTPYQPEISQGRLEALINFQTMVEDLTGLPVAGASMLDEASAAAGRRPGSSSSTPTPCRRRGASCGRGPSRSASGCTSQTFPPAGPTICPRPVPSAFCCPIREPVGRSATTVPWPPRHTRRGPRWWSRPTCSPSRCSRRRGSGAPTSPAARPSASASPWGTVGRTRATCRSAGAWPASCPAAWSVSPSTPTATSPTGSPCRPASSTSAARRRPATSAPPRCCSPSWPAPTRSTTGRRGWQPSLPGCTAAPSCWPAGCEPVGWGWFTSTSSTPWRSRCPAGPPTSSPRPPRAGSTCDWSTPTPWPSPATRPRRWRSSGRSQSPSA